MAEALDVTNPVPTSAADKQKLLDLLRSSRQSFLASFAGVTDEQSRRCPAEGCWSVLDTVEHLTVGETVMLKLVSDTRRPRTQNRPNREEASVRVVVGLSEKLHPSGESGHWGCFANLQEDACQCKA